jgi:hypothetical protein
MSSVSRGAFTIIFRVSIAVIVWFFHFAIGPYSIYLARCAGYSSVPAAANIVDLLIFPLASYVQVRICELRTLQHRKISCRARPWRMSKACDQMRCGSIGFNANDDCSSRLHQLSSCNLPGRTRAQPHHLQITATVCLWPVHLTARSNTTTKLHRLPAWSILGRV